MPYQFTVSPDFSPGHVAGWHIFNTWLQKALGVGVHLELYNTFSDQKSAILEDHVDLIYANPYDASMLIREKNFAPVARPREKPDEAIIAVNADSGVENVEALTSGIRVASTDDPAVNMMGMIMIEPADLGRDDVSVTRCDNYVLVAKELLNGAADVGFFLAQSFNELSSLVRDQLRVLVSSEIHVVHHTMMAGPKLLDRVDAIKNAMVGMGGDDKGARVLESLGLQGWEEVDEEEAEFMIDLMDTLVT